MERGFLVEEIFDLSTRKPRRQFRFLFAANAPGASPPMTDICEVDFDHFTAELKTMGFSRDSYYDSPPHPPPDAPHLRLPHGRLMYDYFDRAEMRVEVYPRGEANDPIERITHACVEWVFIY